MFQRRWLNQAALPIICTFLAALLVATGWEPALAENRESYIAGTVFEDTNRNGAYDRGEAVKAGVTISLRPNSGSGDSHSTMTDSRGEYKIAALRAGTYLLTAELPSGYDSTGNQLVVTVDGTNGTRRANFGLVRMGTASQTASSPTGPAPTAMPTPTLTVAQRVADLPALRSAHFVLEGRSDDNGLVTDFVAEGNVVQPGDLEMRLSIDHTKQDIVLVGPRSYRKAPSEDAWQPTSLSALRNRPGLLSAVDLYVLPSLPGQVRDVRVVESVSGDGGLIRHYRIEMGPPSVPFARGSGQLEVLGGLVEIWMSSSDKLMRAAHLQLLVPSTRLDLTGRVEPAKLDAWLRFSDQNLAFTINEPLLIAQPTPLPAPPLAAVPSGGAAAAAPAPGRPIAQPARTPTPSGEVSANAVLPTPTPVAEVSELSRERAAAADRALRALGGAVGPEPGSVADGNRVSLAVPWRSHVADPSGERPSTDGPASLGMILEAYGIKAETAEIEALAERWQESWGPTEQARLATLVRIGVRGSLRPLGPAYGTGGDEWSAAVARDYLRRGYPVLALVSPALLSAGPSDAQLLDRYITLIGFDGDTVVYHDSTTPEGVSKRVGSIELDRAWASAIPPRQGAAFGFGSNVIGLLNLVSAQAAPTAPEVTPLAVPTLSVLIEPQAAPVEQGVGGAHPALLAFVVAVASGIGFVVSRLIR